MSTETLMLSTVFVPILGSLTIPLVAQISSKARSVWSLLLGIVTSLCPILLIPFALKGGNLVVQKPLVYGFDAVFVADALSIFMAIVSSFIGGLIVFYSLGYVKHEEEQNEYYLMVLLFIGAMMGLVFSANLIMMYLFWEISAICCWRLIGFYREKEHVIKADKSFLVTFGGAVVMLFGFITIYNQTGTFNLLEMRGTTISSLAVVLILIGMFSKSATVPIHTWLPDAGVAPSTVTALLHAAVLVKIGVYAFARIFCFTFTLPNGWYTWIPVLAMLSALISACAAMVDNNMKRILAYSTVSQIGYIFLGFGMFNQVGIAGALLFILMHGLAKAGLFLCAGVVEHATHTKDIREMGGLIKTMPITAISYLLCALSVIGIPPLGGFFSKFMVIMATVKGGQIWVAALAIFTAGLTLLYLFRLFNAVFLGEAKKKDVYPVRSSVSNGVHEGTPVMLITIASLAVLSLLAGILVRYPMQLVNVATMQIVGGMK
ncbi:MAG: NADH-quinone oxidoreductase subunit L [Candidatus Edwardsbacteria bacterium]